jgi:DNA repair protein RecN (Recombination protein N)
LRQIETRIEALHTAARKHRVRPEELPARLADLERQLKELELAANPDALRREVAAARKVFDGHAKKLSAKRKAAAEALGKAVTAAMQQFAMAGAKFAISLKELPEPGPSGAEQVEFEVASHPSLPLRPLAKVASGGELSRVSLAIQLVAAKSSPVGALVFDEIDSGIGGAVAETIGKSLRQLGRQRQVLCVTHLPQVAASGNEKQRRGDRQRDDGGADHAGPEKRQPGSTKQQIVEDQRAGDAPGDGERCARRPHQQVVHSGIRRVAWLGESDLKTNLHDGEQ